MIDCYIEHRIEVIRRRTSHLLKEARKKAHLLEGLIYAVCDIDEVIRLIRASATRDEAIARLMERKFRIALDHKYAPLLPRRLLDRVSGGDGGSLTRVQAESIGRLQLIQLVGLEVEKLTGDYTAIVAEIQGFESILGNQQLVLDIIRKDIVEIREKFGDKRRSQIVESAEDINDADLIAVEDMVLTISHEGYIKRLSVDTYQEQGRGGRGIKGSEKKDSDFIEHLFVASTHDDLLCLTDTGRMFKIKVYEAPEMGRTSKGRPIVNYLDLREGERVRTFIPVKDFEQREDYLVFATANGTVKRTALKDYRNVNRNGIIAINLREGDELMSMVLTSGENDLLLATANGMAIRFNEQDVRVMGRSASGVRGINLELGDHVIGLIIADDSCDLLTVTEFGYGKRTAMTEYLVQSDDGSTRVQSRGGKGRRDIRVSKRNGRSVAILAVREVDSVLLVTECAMMVRIAAASIGRIGRNTQGVRVTNLKDGDRLIAVAKVVDSDNEVSEG